MVSVLSVCIKMKRLLCILAALAMFVCSASSTYAVEEGDVVYPQAGDSQAAPRNATPDNCIFVSCPFCKVGTVCLYCTGTTIRNEVTYDCKIPSHNEDEPCRVVTVYCGTEGYCLDCIYNSNVENPMWPFSKEHRHRELHYPNGSFNAEEWGSCPFRS